MGMDGLASVRKEYEQQRSENLKSLETAKESQKSRLVADAKEKENQMELSIGEQIETVKGQLFRIGNQIEQYQSALNNPNLPPGERAKIQEALINLKKHKAYLSSQFYALRNRLRSSKKMLWYHIRTRSEMIDNSVEEQKSLTLRKYAEIFVQLANREAIAKAQQAAMQKQGGGLNRKKAPRFGEGAAESGKMAA